MSGRVWEVIRGRLHALIASERFVLAPDSETRVHGYVGASQSVILKLGATSLDVLQRVRSLLGERINDQVRAAIEEKLPAEEAISSASKTVAQQSDHVVKLRLAREEERVIAEIRTLPPSAARRAELAALVCERLKSNTPLDMFISARQEADDRVATGLITLAPRWSGLPEALQVPVAALDAEWMVHTGEAILMTARRVGAEAFLVEALLRARTPPPRLVEALHTNLVGPDDAAALIRLVGPDDAAALIRRVGPIDKVTELELQFAQNPRSDAYIALCEAYLAQGRSMEAMVVAKMGIKAHPDAVEAKLLLSRVYEAQRKFPRALDTLAAALASHPDDPRVYALPARVNLANGDQDSAIQDLKRTITRGLPVPGHDGFLVLQNPLSYCPDFCSDFSSLAAYLVLRRTVLKSRQK